MYSRRKQERMLSKAAGFMCCANELLEKYSSGLPPDSDLHQSMSYLALSMEALNKRRAQLKGEREGTLKDTQTPKEQ